MEWTEGYGASWEVCTVDPSTWSDSGEVSGVMTVSVSRDCTDSVPLLETGSMEVDGSFGESWCRIYMTADQGGVERIPMATLLFEQESSTVDHRARRVTASGRSVLQPAADVKMARGSYAPSGCDGAEFAASLLRACTPAPVVVHGSFTLVDDVVFDLGCSNLEAAWLVLNAGNFCIQIDGDGTINVLSMPTEPSLRLDEANAGLLIPGVSDDLSLIDVPNRYYAVDGEHIAVAVNERDDSAVSRQNRGRWVDMVDSSPVLVDGESLEAYAERRLAEESVVERKFSYTREFYPGVVPYSLVRAVLPDDGIEGDLRVKTQSLECGKGVTVSEDSYMEVSA